MRYPVVIDSNGKCVVYKSNSNIPLLRQLKKTIDSWKLQPTKILMSEADYADLLAYTTSSK